MKFFFRLVTPLLLLSVPVVSFATAQQQAAQEAAAFVEIVNRVIIFPIIALLSAIAFFIFLWGCAQYILNANNDQGRQQGVKHITYGIIGLIVMISAFALMTIIATSFGLDDELTCAADPAGCSSAFTIP